MQGAGRLRHGADQGAVWASLALLSRDRAVATQAGAAGLCLRVLVCAVAPVIHPASRQVAPGTGRPSTASQEPVAGPGSASPAHSQACRQLEPRCRALEAPRGWGVLPGLAAGALLSRENTCGCGGQARGDSSPCAEGSPTPTAEVSSRPGEGGTGPGPAEVGPGAQMRRGLARSGTAAGGLAGPETPDAGSLASVTLLQRPRPSAEPSAPGGGGCSQGRADGMGSLLCFL